MMKIICLFCFNIRLSTLSLLFFQDIFFLINKQIH